MRSVRVAELAASFDRARGEQHVRSVLVDGLRGSAVVGADPRPFLPLLADDPWEARLILASETRQPGDGQGASSLRDLLRTVSERDGEDLMVEDAAIRANLAASMVREAWSSTISAADRETVLRDALVLLEDACQVPEALLNSAAIHLKLSEIAQRVATSESPETVQARVDQHLASAEGALLRLVADAGSSCADDRRSFFGVRLGGRVAFLIDRSIDLRSGEALVELRRRLKRAIADLPDRASFSILFFGGMSSEPSTSRESAEVEVPARFNDRGMFRRALLGRPGEGAGLDEVFAAIDAVAPEVITSPESALRRAISLEPELIVLVTDGPSFMLDDAARRELGDALRREKVRMESVLYVDPAKAVQRSVSEAVSALRSLSQGTSGGIIVTCQPRGAGESGPLLGDDRFGEIRPEETIRERARRLGQWNDEAERQFLRIAGAIALHRGDAESCLAMLDQAMLPAVQDVVTAALPTSSVDPEWPRVAPGVAAPNDPSLLYESGLVAALLGRDELALDRLDSAARMWSRCASEARHGDDAAVFRDLASRAILIRAMIGGEIDLKQCVARLEAARLRAIDLGVDGGAGWSSQLMDAAQGGVAGLKARIALSLAPAEEAERSAAELDLVQAVFGGAGQTPTAERFVDLPLPERRLFGSIAARLAARESP